MTGEDFSRETHHAGVDFGRDSAVVHSRHALPQPTRRTQLCDQASAHRIGIRGMQVAYLGCRPSVQFARKLPVPVFEERPAQVIQRSGQWGIGGHQLPSKTGFVFATKAR
jgi:hypothetical protein